MKNRKQTEKSSQFIRVFKSYFRKEEALLLPNILCYFRILLVFVFLAVYLSDFSLAGNENANVYFATAIMVVASYTDFIDGYIARTFHLQSNLGQVLDPIADKLLQFAIVLALCIRFYMFPSLFMMLVIFVLKELTLMIQDIYLARNNKSFGGAKWYGKLSTFLFYLVLGSLLFFGPSIVRIYPLDTEVGLKTSHFIFDSLCTFAIFFLLLAWILYSVAVHKLISHGHDDVPDQKMEENKHD